MSDDTRLRARFWAKVDKSGPDGHWLWTAAKDRHGYGRFNHWEERRTVFAHRFAYQLVNGLLPPEGLDHICHTPGCVNPEHLRPATQKQNNENRSRFTGKSRVRGVHWNGARSKWQVTVGHSGRSYYGGLYPSLDEAERAAIAFRNRLFTHNARDRS